MRKELFYNPRLLIERLAESSIKKRRMDKLNNTCAKDLDFVHITSLEFLEICNSYSKSEVIFDVGANEGKWSKLAKAVCPKSKIYSFEPTPQYQKEFLENTQGLQDIYLQKVAVGSTNEVKKFNFAGHSSSFLEIGDILAQNYNTPKEYEIDVQVVKLDDYIAEKNIPQPDLIKLDIEGYELEALIGCQRLLKSVKFLILEVSFLERHIGQPLFPELAYHLSNMNFNIYAFPLNMHLGRKINMTDVLFYNKSLIKPL